MLAGWPESRIIQATPGWRVEKARPDASPESLGSPSTVLLAPDKLEPQPSAARPEPGRPSVKRAVTRASPHRPGPSRGLKPGRCLPARFRSAPPRTGADVGG